MKEVVCVTFAKKKIISNQQVFLKSTNLPNLLKQEFSLQFSVVSKHTF